MYYQYFGLREAPFSIAVNPRYLFMSHRHRDALAHLLYGVGSGGGFILLTGEVGTGKTTINRCLLEQLPDDTDIAIILNPALNALELLASVCDELGIEAAGDATSLKSLTDRLHAFLLENHARGRRTVLLIDEAQHLDFPVLEQIRLLTNLETNSEKLLHIILIGQPELAEMLRRPELRQLNQRITARYNLEPLSREETAAYIRHRLTVAGLAPGTEVFPPGVVRALHRRTRGIPRLINLLCDRMLLGAYGRNSPRVDHAMLRRAAQEVTGEGMDSRKPWLLALAGAAAVLALAVWWLRPASQAVSADSAVPAVAVQSAAPLQVPPQQQAAAEATVAAAAPAAASPPATAVLAPEVDDWLLPPEAALATLWRLYTDQPLPRAPCATDVQRSLRCTRARAATWQQLQPLQAPLVLEVVTPQRFAAAVLVLQLDATRALLATPQGTREVALSAIAPLWQGDYSYLWSAPSGFSKAIGVGDRGPAVAYIAQLFAAIDGQQAPLTEDFFTPTLKQRVQLFQREQGLDDDGLVGEQTLQRMHRVARRVPAGERLRERMASLQQTGAWL